MSETAPKVFVSYSWSSAAHQAAVKRWADQLIADGIDVVLDLYDLKEGNDKYAFMERIITDTSVTHVLLVCDKAYSEKADERKAGVGTESQIISKEVYDKVAQSKFIPLACELAPDGNPYLPVFLKSRIWIDFSSPEAANENWEQLVRLLFGKPLHEKPALGKPPVYVTSDSALPSSPALHKYSSLKQAILQAKPGVAIYRSAFLDACLDFTDSLRTRERPNVEKLGEKVLADCGHLKQVRNHIVDWVLLEATVASTDDFADTLIAFLERLREMKSRPVEITQWNDAWFEAHALFAYEAFLYIVAALLKAKAYGTLHEVFTSHYLRPTTDRYGDQAFDTFDCFYAHSETLQHVLALKGQRLFSPAAELIKRQADRGDIPFAAIIEAELLILLMSLITPNAKWYPGTLHYSSYSKEFPLFLRATQHKGFQNLAIITGFETADKLREAVKEGFVRMGTNRWRDFDFNGNFWGSMNLDKLDTLK